MNDYNVFIMDAMIIGDKLSLGLPTLNITNLLTIDTCLLINTVIVANCCNQNTLQTIWFYKNSALLSVQLNIMDSLCLLLDLDH